MSAVLPSTAAERVAQSREHLRQALHAGRGSRRPAADASGAPIALPWFARLKSIPGAAIAIDALELWWARHPARLPVTLAGHTANTVLRPIAQRHPVSLVFSALAVGAVFAWSRPWRWALKPAVFAGLLPQLLMSAMKQAPSQSDRSRAP